MIDSAFVVVLMTTPVRGVKSVSRTVAKKVVGKTGNAKTANAASKISVYVVAVMIRTALRVSAVWTMNAAKHVLKTPVVERGESAKRVCAKRVAATIRAAATMRAATTTCA